MEQILHLFIKKECRHDCPDCCNKFYDIEKIPVVTVELLKSVQTVCLTGGEPFSIKPEILVNFVHKLRKQYKNIVNLYIYTSGKEFAENTKDICTMFASNEVNGINIAPKDIKDWLGFLKVLEKSPALFYNRSNRLYVFKEQIPIFKALNIKIPESVNIIYRQWQTTFNTPENEHFARLPILM